MTDILLIGSFHFMDSGTDFCSPEVQEALDSFANTLLRFSPYLRAQASVSAPFS